MENDYEVYTEDDELFRNASVKLEKEIGEFLPNFKLKRWLRRWSNMNVGDYVNGSKVIEINNEDKDIFNKYLIVDEVDYDDNNISYSNNDINSVVTKEQFESVKYRIGE